MIRPLVELFSSVADQPPQAACGGNLCAEVLHGLRQHPKRIACKFFYDHRGSALFDSICQQPEYYPTRTEYAILARHAHDIANLVGPDCFLVEYGSGSSTKTRVLLDGLARPAAYVPVDIAREHLMATARRLARDYPLLPILPVCADFTHAFALPPAPPYQRIMAFFPGSTIGNFTPCQAVAFLLQVRALIGPHGSLLIGVDLKKDPHILHAAYNDAAGITAAFNLNLLVRFNRELAANFILDHFTHYACYNARLGRIEMHLVSLCDQSITLADSTISLTAGETVFTECSYKYSLEQFTHLARVAGFRASQVWRDPQNLFSVFYLVALRSS